MKYSLATQSTGDTENLPEGTVESVNPNSFRIQEAGGATASNRSSRDGQSLHAKEMHVAVNGGTLDVSKPKGLRFTDKDEHMYFWFPLLAGLSELTFDPRPDIRFVTSLLDCNNSGCICEVRRIHPHETLIPE